MIPAERLRGARGPPLPLHGEYEDSGEPAQPTTTHKPVPHAECDLLPRLAHFPHLDDHEGVVDSVADFVKRQSG